MRKSEKWLLCLGITGFCLAASLTAAQTTKDENRSNDDGNVVVEERKLWALGCSAVLIERNCRRHDLLGTVIRTERNIKKMKKFLVTSGWDIKNRADLFENLQWIKRGGHRRKFEGWGTYLKTLNPQQYEQALKASENNPNELQKIKITKEYYQKLGPKSLSGWDYSRYICLCRWGYMADYLSEEEAWELIMPVAEMLQKTFDSWEDLGQNYIIGRQFWSYEETQRNGYLYEDAYQRLLDMPSSPWNKYPWNMNLSYPPKKQRHRGMNDGLKQVAENVKNPKKCLCGGFNDFVVGMFQRPFETLHIKNNSRTGPVCENL